MRKILYRYMIFFLLIVSLIGCAGLQRAHGWYGRTVDDVIAQRGYPMERRDLGRGAEVLVYPSMPTMNEFFISKDGRVVDHYVRYQGGLF
jgi:hypothetical protein